MKTQLFRSLIFPACSAVLLHEEDFFHFSGSLSSIFNSRSCFGGLLLGSRAPLYRLTVHRSIRVKVHFPAKHWSSWSAVFVKQAVSITLGVAAHIMNQSMPTGSYWINHQLLRNILLRYLLCSLLSASCGQDVVAKLFRCVWINYLVEEFQATVSSLRWIKHSLALLIWNILSWKVMRLITYTY